MTIELSQTDKSILTPVLELNASNSTGLISKLLVLSPISYFTIIISSPSCKSPLPYNLS